MLTVDQALALVAARVQPRPPCLRAAAESLGLVLAESITSDVDSPPHDKSLVDGYAVIAADLTAGQARLRVLEEVTAGRLPTQPLQAGAATRIMTGAPLPAGTEAVVMIERTKLITSSGGASHVEIDDPSITPGRNILLRGLSLRAGDVVLEPGHVLRPIEVGLLAEVGRTQVRVVPAPRVAVLSTGDELVDAAQAPAPGQIRNSNGPLLGAALVRLGAVAVDLGIARDRRDDLAERIARGLDEADVLLLSGGVSAGVLDLVPSVLTELGVEQVLHKVQLKPGKPVWFGVRPDARGDRLVFGLPGNPVGTLVCFELFVRPALARLAGRPFAGAEIFEAPLAAEFAQRGDRPTYHPGRLVQAQGQTCFEPLVWHGSADLRTLATADVLVQFAAGERGYRRGDIVRGQRL